MCIGINYVLNSNVVFIFCVISVDFKLGEYSGNEIIDSYQYEQILFEILFENIILFCMLQLLMDLVVDCQDL